MSQYIFGAGIMWGQALTDASGNAITNPSPVQFGTLQDCSLDISFDTKMLHGQNQFPVAVGRGKGKLSGKAKAAQINGLVWNSLFFGQTMTKGIIGDVYDTTGTAIPGTPYTIAPTPPSSGTWLADLGVRNSSGVPLTRVASAPTTGQYAVTSAATGTASFATNVMTVTAVTTGVFAVGQSITSAGVAAGTISSLGTGTGGTGTYNLSTSPGTISAQAVTAGVGYQFAAADTGLTMFINYQYTATSTTANKSTVVNLPMGYAPSFRCDLSLPFQGKNLILSAPNAISSKLTLSPKNDDFTIPEFDFECFADASGNVLTWAMTE
jgi:hypothetical protein